MSPLTPRLFKPIQVGELQLSHRVVLAPLTRFRGTITHVPGPYAAEYYAQRGSVPGTLLITEATFIAQRAGGYKNVPGIWSEEQIAGWKEVSAFAAAEMQLTISWHGALYVQVTTSVHAKGSSIFLQLWAMGRAADPAVLASEDPSIAYVSSSPSPLPQKSTQPPPRALSVPEIHEYVQLYATAAANAVHRAGFDGVE